jgi:hypothetical protein
VLAKVQSLIARATDFHGAILAEGAAEAVRRIAISMDIPKALVADAAELLIWAQGKVGRMLGEPKQGRPEGSTVAADGTLTSPDGEVKPPDRMARHRYRELAGIDEEELQGYLVEAREKYLADDARIAVFSPRAVSRAGSGGAWWTKISTRPSASGRNSISAMASMLPRRWFDPALGGLAWLERDDVARPHEAGPDDLVVDLVAPSRLPDQDAEIGQDGQRPPHLVGRDLGLGSDHGGRDRNPPAFKLEQADDGVPDP